MDIDTATQTLANSKKVIWQVIEKDDIDFEDRLTEKQWEAFVERVQNKLAEEFSDMVEQELDIEIEEKICEIEEEDRMTCMDCFKIKHRKDCWIRNSTYRVVCDDCYRLESYDGCCRGTDVADGKYAHQDWEPVVDDYKIPEP